MRCRRRASLPYVAAAATLLLALHTHYPTITSAEWPTVAVVQAQGVQEHDSNRNDEGRVLQTSASSFLQTNSGTNGNGGGGACTHQPSLTTSSSSTAVVERVLSYLDEHRSSIEGTILQSYTNHFENETVPSAQYLYDDFRSSLEWMATVGVRKPPGGGASGGGGGGDDAWRFYLGPDNCNNDGYHIGLANVASFLSQAMTMVIQNDTCSELNWEQIFPNPMDEFPKGYYPLSNSCGQRGVPYDGGTTFHGGSSFHACPAGEEAYQCRVDPGMRTTSSSRSRSDNSPPPMRCFPRVADRTVTGYYDPLVGKVVTIEGDVVPSRTGRTDVEGCCFWGRGALHTRGVCNLGKLNYFLGAGGASARSDNRYADVDFCSDPESICTDESRTMEMRWTVALFEWVERVQSYDDGDWNYLRELTEFAAGGRDVVESVQFSLLPGEPPHFIDRVGGVLEQGCPDPPCDLDNPNYLMWKGRRKRNFVTTLQGVGLPVKSEAFRVVEAHFTELVKDDFESVLLQSRSPVDGTTYQSYRYRYVDWMESLRIMSDIGFDGKLFYIGQGGGDSAGTSGSPSSPGLLNIALFLSYAIEMSILDDACDEHNTQLINGRFPVSNACGQYGSSYQDIVCDAEDAGMECPLDLDQTVYAMTRPLDDKAPQHFKCAPKTLFPVTGFWDEVRLEENYDTAFANQLGRIDIEGCCWYEEQWWGRGALREVTRGRCVFGQMNHFIGKRAAEEGRPSLYADVDFCKYQESICASEYSGELQWVAGMFFWVKYVQSFSKDGFNYIETLHELSEEMSTSGELNSTLIMSIDCIMRTGTVDCESAQDISGRLREVLPLVTSVQMPTASPTLSINPSESPTRVPTVSPTGFPTTSPTSTLSPTASPNIFTYPQRQDVDNVLKIVEDKRADVETKLLTPRIEIDNKNLYSFDAFTSSLRALSDGSVQGIYFYVGHNIFSSRAFRKRGIVNIAAFLAYAKTTTVDDSICDEQNVDDIDGLFPLSNACGQHGQSYQNLRCHLSESFMECPPDTSLQMTAVAPLTSTDEKQGPPPFFCGPRQYFPFMGYYDRATGKIQNDNPFSNRAGRTDVEGCCWWGRGAAQLKGVCLYGKLNYHLGARAKKEGRRSLFPDVDFCQYPQAICSGPHSYSLMWITGLFVWIELVQSNPDYSDYLDNYVEGTLGDDAFIDAISDILGSGEDERIAMRSNWALAVDALGVKKF